ncbi:MAG: GDP-L-fucose synthase [Hyphomonadaceae bacterium]|nr:GDP-L-fucose synthase [Hyphomonadaceae bacterium]
MSGKTVWVAGHNGMVGSAIVRRLKSEGIGKLLTVDRGELDLTDQAAVRIWVANSKPDIIFLAAAKVGGIAANDRYPADFIYQNLAIASNVIDAAYRANVEKLVNLGSSCVYPKFASQPIEESALLTGPLEPTNEWYAIAKIASLKMCAAYRKQYGCDFISAMPTNLYGQYDNFHPENSHVLPALIRKAHIAKQENAASMEIWGSGKALREFMYADDCADALVFLSKYYSADEHVNLGTGKEFSIKEIAEIIMKIVGFEGALETDMSRPDGTPRKLLNSEKIEKMGWVPKTTLEQGIADTYKWYKQKYG